MLLVEPLIGNSYMLVNCDLGESFGAWKMGQDDAFMALIDQANIACGFHAGDPSGMRKTLELAKHHDVSIGAHPAYPDLQGFGRRSMKMEADLITDMVLYQISALDGLAHSIGKQVNYVKPHGALYNDMMQNTEVLGAIVRAIHQYHRPIELMVQSLPNNDIAKGLAASLGIQLLFEAFADRRYTDAGFLMSRQHQYALLSESEVEEQVILLRNEQRIVSESGKIIKLEVDSVCVHSDSESALEKAKIVHKIMKNNNGFGE